MRGWPLIRGDVVTEAFEAAFEVGDGSGLADLVEIGFAEVAIGQVLGEHVIGGDEDFVSDGERCAQGAAAGLEAMELVLEGVTFRTPPGLAVTFFPKLSRKALKSHDSRLDSGSNPAAERVLNRAERVLNDAERVLNDVEGAQL